MIEPILLTSLSEQNVSKQRPSEVINLMYLLPNFMELTLRKQIDFEKAEQLIYKSVKCN